MFVSVRWLVCPFVCLRAGLFEKSWTNSQVVGGLYTGTRSKQLDFGANLNPGPGIFFSSAYLSLYEIVLVHY